MCLFSAAVREIFVAGEKQPVLRQNNAGSAAFLAEFQATLEKDGGKVILAAG